MADEDEEVEVNLRICLLREKCVGGFFVWVCPIGIFS